jgi:heme-degrading monooxygenase HmoA
MLCALTVRKLRPGSFEQFAQAFRPADDAMPSGWVRFHMLRDASDEDEAITFGFFDGTLEEMRASFDDSYQQRLEAIAPYVESVGADGIYDVVVEEAPEGASPTGARLCALTVRNLRPGMFEQFVEAFRPSPAEEFPKGWVRFHLLRGVSDENQVVTFGFFDSTVEDLKASQAQDNYRKRLEAIAPFVESVGTDGFYDIVVEASPEGVRSTLQGAQA